MQDFIREVMGSDFVEPPQFDLNASYLDSNCCIPLMFILAPGTDPTSEFLRFAEEQGFDKNRLLSLSMGQGQGPIATKTIDEGVKAGSWVLLQNCHMAKGWMNTLELIYENLAPDATHPDFRLWMTSEPSDYFPKSILQTCVKMIYESPRSLRSHVTRSYASPLICKAEWFNAKTHTGHFRRLLYSLCFFHAVIRERCQFGSIGWSMPYQFTDIDLTVGINSVESIMDGKSEVDFVALRYLIDDCIYGERVSNCWDQRCLKVLLSQFLKGEILEKERNTFFENCDLYYCPQEEQHEEILDSIRSMPLNAIPQVFGLHDNASIFKNQQEIDYMLESILCFQVRCTFNKTKSMKNVWIENSFDSWKPL